MDVVLVGPSLPGVENHAIGALLAALREADLSATFVPFEGFTKLESRVSALLSLKPKTVGVSLQTIESAIPVGVFTMLLRRRGFQGRILVGGHFATLNVEALLQSPASIDAVVQFAGEDAVVAVARGALDDMKVASAVPGLVFRGPCGEIRRGSSAKWTSPAVLSQTRRFGPLPEHLGVCAADIVSSRGCEAHCSYCCIAAASDLARNGENGSPSHVYERRTVSALADEIAALFHGHGARVFNFMDDNALPIAPDEAADWAEELKRELQNRHVPSVAFSLQLRADVVTERSARALAELGVGRAYVGIDGYSSSQLRVLGRNADSKAGHRALELLWQQGVFSVANALLVGPTIPFESIIAEAEALGRIEHAPVHLLPIEVRAGTSYFKAAERRGLIEGGFLYWHYRFADERTERMAEILTSFPTRLAERSVPIALYDLGYNLGIVRRITPDVDISRHVATYARVAAMWNASQARILRKAIAIAKQNNRSAVAAFVAEELAGVTSLDRRLRNDSDDALAEIARECSLLRRRRVSPHSRGKLLGAIAFSMSLAACGGSDEAGKSTSGGGAAAGGGTGGTHVTTGGTAGAGGTSSGGMQGIGGTLPDGATATCPAVPVQRGTGYVSPESSCDSALVRFDGSGRAVAFLLPDGGAPSPEIVACLTTLFEPYCYPSLANTTQPFSPHVWIA